MAFNKAKALQEAEKSVSQRKFSQAIKQYLEIAEKDPADLNLLNTIGDLYVREGNIQEALRMFHRLAEAYAQERFIVKAIAIYKKIGKLVPESVDPLLKLAELYGVQRLVREAREQYSQALELCKKTGRNERVLEIVRKVVELDPENAANQARLAQYCEDVGLKTEAGRLYRGVAEVALRRGEPSVAEFALKKAIELGANDPELPLLRARLALETGRADQVERILSAALSQGKSPKAWQLLISAQVATGNLVAAHELALQAYHTEPRDFAPLGWFCARCVEKGNLDAPLKLLAEAVGDLLAHHHADPLMEMLRQIQSARPQHVPALELMLYVSEQTLQESAELFEALGRAYLEAGQFEKAEAMSQRLLQHQPGSDAGLSLLGEILARQGWDCAGPGPAVPASPAGPESLVVAESPVEPEIGEPAPVHAKAPSIDTSTALMVEEALENSDLYARYGLAERAVQELEKILAVYPDRLEIHKRILEVCRENLSARAARAATDIARIYSAQNDPENAKAYLELARRFGGRPFGKDASEEAPAGLASEAPPCAGEEARVPEAPSTLVPDTAGAESTSQEWDLSSELESLDAAAREAPIEVEVFPVDLSESRAEIKFYLDYGFVSEARLAVKSLEEEFPGHPQVEEFRRLVDQSAPAMTKEAAEVPSSLVAAPEAPEQPAPSIGSRFASMPRRNEDLAIQPQADDFPVAHNPACALSEADSKHAPASLSGTLEWPEMPAPEPPAESGIAAGPSASPAEMVGRAPIPGAADGPLDSSVPNAQAYCTLFEDELAGWDQKASNPSLPPEASSPAGVDSANLSSLLAEFEEGPEGGPARNDADVHYNLGVAFHEMELLDEAIGELQKVVKSTGKEDPSLHFLPACSLLAHCFMQKGMPELAVKWYQRALQSPAVGDEVRMALQYEIGVAYQDAGDSRSSLEYLLEVYGQNVDYRDVAERIRLLRHKPESKDTAAWPGRLRGDSLPANLNRTDAFRL